jgi:hypothetical protein
MIFSQKDYPEPDACLLQSFSSHLRPLVSFLILVGTVILLFACSVPQPAVIAITHVAVIEATGTPPQLDFTVLISGTHISAVGPTSSIAIPHGAKALDATGKFLIPGLADMHLHLTGAGEPTGSREFVIPLLVANGITTVRDMGGNVEFLAELRREIDSGDNIGPQIFFSGPYLDGNPPSFQPSIVVQNAAEAIAAVQKLKSAGVDFIKVQSRLRPEAYFAIAEESRNLGIRFVGHVPDSITAATASDAGQASIEHLTGVFLGCSKKEEELRRRKRLAPPARDSLGLSLERDRVWQQNLLDSYSPEKASQLFLKFAANRTWQVPTFPLLMDLAFLLPGKDWSNDPRMKYVPQSVRILWDQARSESLAKLTKGDVALRALFAKRSLGTVRAMHAAGVALMAGTDATAPNVFPGFSLHEDLAYLVQAGMTPMEALQAATSRPGEFLGKSSEQGTVEAGKRADLVLLDANPLEDIRNTKKIHAVILNGRLLESRDLGALLVKAKRFAATH